MDIFALSDGSLWGILAVVLLAAEMLTTAYVALGFAMAAGAMALVVWLVPGLPIVVQGLIWAVLGLLSWLALQRLSRRKRSRRDINDFDSRDSLPKSDRDRPDQ
jgi:membrane protein implicated in regulation of membrane protease activity